MERSDLYQTLILTHFTPLGILKVMVQKEIKLSVVIIYTEQFLST